MADEDKKQVTPEALKAYADFNANQKVGMSPQPQPKVTDEAVSAYADFNAKNKTTSPAIIKPDLNTAINPIETGSNFKPVEMPSVEKTGLIGAAKNIATIAPRTVGEGIGQGIAATQTAIETPGIQKLLYGTEGIKNQQSAPTTIPTVTPQQAATQPQAAATVIPAPLSEKQVMESVSMPRPNQFTENYRASTFVPSGVSGVYQGISEKGNPSFADKGYVESLSKNKNDGSAYVPPQLDAKGKYIAPPSTAETPSVSPTMAGYQQAPIQSNVLPDRFANEAFQRNVVAAQSAVAGGMENPSNAQARYAAKLGAKNLEDLMGYDVQGKIKTQQAEQELGQKDLAQRRGETMEGWKSLLAQESAGKSLAQRGQEQAATLGQQESQFGRSQALAEKKLALESRPAPERSQVVKEKNAEGEEEAYVLSGGKINKASEMYQQQKAQQANQQSEAAHYQSLLTNPKISDADKQEAQKRLTAMGVK